MSNAELDGGKRNHDVGSSRPGTTMTRRRLIKATAGVTVGLIGGLFGLRSEKAFAKPRHVKVRAYDRSGRPRSGVAIHFYELPSAHVDRCECSDDRCGLRTDHSSSTNKGGLAKVVGLKPGTMYEVCMDDRCETVVDPCANPRTDCRYRPGPCETFTTNNRGGTSRTIELRAT